MCDARGLLQRFKRAVGVRGSGNPNSAPREFAPATHRASSCSPQPSAPLPSHWFRSAALLDVRGLRVVSADIPAATLVDDISLSITWGEVIGLVGEDGSGAVQVAQCIAGVLTPGAKILSGSILFNGAELINSARRSGSSLGDASIAYLPRDPIVNLDATQTIGAQLTAPLRSRFGLSRLAAHQQSIVLLRQAGDTNPLHTVAAYPHEVSAAVAQRVHIAQALAGRPKLLVADNPTAGMSASDGRAIMNLLDALQRELELTVIIVTHSVTVAQLICHRVAIVRAGAIVEYASVTDLVHAPKHPYTRELLSAAGHELPGPAL